jgi:transcriptional regulator
MPTQPLGILQGTLDVLILRALAWQSMHGFAVSEWIRQRAGGAIVVEEAALYKALHRLERDGAVSAEWGVSENNRRARYYELTAKGRRQLREASLAWRRYSAAVDRVLAPA